MTDTEIKERVKQRRRETMAGAQSRLDAQQGGRAVVKFISSAVDELMIDLWREVAGDASDAIDLVAIGGYGRAELCPESDWDLLFLVSDARDAQINALIQRYAQIVWDSGAHLGHAVRTPDEARTFAASDHHTRTALLESRLLNGSGKLYARLQKSSAPQGWSKRQRVDFCRTKLEECAARRQHSGGDCVRYGTGYEKTARAGYAMSARSFGSPWPGTACRRRAN